MRAEILTYLISLSELATLPIKWPVSGEVITRKNPIKRLLINTEISKELRHTPDNMVTRPKINPFEEAWSRVKISGNLRTPREARKIKREPKKIKIREKFFKVI
jgi:hypothetical protein